jgi:hypothetical protein
MVYTIQKAWHHIVAACEEISSYYGGNLQGTGQGNGAESMIWAIISAVLITIPCECTGMVSVSYAVCSAFVDNTNAIHGTYDVSTSGNKVL